MCPCCRTLDAGRLSIAELRDDGPAWRCARCDARHPNIDGIPVILREREAWLAATARDDLLRRAFASPVASPLRRDLSARVARLRGAILDMGCGGGALYDRRGTCGLDINLAMARAFPGPAIVADAADPPFAGASFDAVLLLNVLDACVHPPLVLAQADALLRAGGRLLISCAYAWTAAVPEGRRFTPADLINSLEGRASPMPLRGRYRLREVRDGIRWRVPVSDRLVHEYRCQVIEATKLRTPGRR